MSNKVIISCAMTGGATPKSKNSAVPTTPEEIAADVYESWKAGAAIVHLHMRIPEDQSKDTMDPALFRKTIDLIRGCKDCDVIINCTSTSMRIPDEERVKHFIEIPEIEIGSCDVGTFNWDDKFVFSNSPDFLHKLTDIYMEHDVKPEMEIFDYGMLQNALLFFRNGRAKPPLLCQFMLGVVGAMDAEVEHLLYLVRHLPEGVIWSAAGIGKGHLPILYAAIAMGGNVRVGLEDNLYYDRGVKATNPMLVARAARVVKEFNKQPATSAEAREILGIKQLVR